MNRLAENEIRVRAWLASSDVDHSTVFYFDSPHECLKAAWGFSGGLDMSLGAFIDSLHSIGIEPAQRGTRPENIGTGKVGVFELRLLPVLSVAGGSDHGEKSS